MSLDAVELSAPARAVIREEEGWLARVATALGAAREHAAHAAAREGMRSAEGVRALREEAMSASEDDLPTLLHELSVRQALRDRPASTALPDPSSPYLAHLAIREGAAQRDYFLGQVSFVDPAAGVRVVDWRVAPVARIFYRCRDGEEFEESFPGRDVEGTVISRRVVVITGGLLERIVAGGMVLERLADGRWVERSAAWSFHEGGAGTAARSLGVGAGASGRARAADVTALLDPTQFAAVSAKAEQPLLVIGSAGSGKTTVALHRLARIAAAEPKRFPLDRAAVVVPEEGLARLSRRLLDPLAGPRGAARVRTLDAWSVELARAVFGPDAPKRCVPAPGLTASLKRSPALHDALRERFAGKKKGSLAPKRLWKALAELFTDRPFLEGVVAASRGALSRACVEETVEHTMLQLAEPFSRHLATIVVPEMKVAVDGRPIVEGTPDELAGTIDLEDLPILLCLRAWRGELDAAPAIAHLVVDEAEDFSLFELFLLGKLLAEPRSVTLAGDEAQQTQASFAGWDRALAALAVHDAATCRLGVSYRCPRPIVELARTILGPLAPASAEAAREGAPVGLLPFPDEPSAEVFLAGALRDLVDREPHASIAVISRDPEAARRFHGIVAEATDARLTLDGAFRFEPGIDVTHVDDVKGLEFDYVVVPDASAEAYPETDVARRRLHVAVTRASHQLWVLWGGAPSPLLGVAEG